MTSVHRKKLKELMKREGRRFIAEHPKSAALYKCAFTWKIATLAALAELWQATLFFDRGHARHARAHSYLRQF